MTSAFTCPLCGSTSHSAEDERHGYCGRCHGFTADLLKPWPTHRAVFVWIGPVTAQLGEVDPKQPPLPQVVEMLRGVVERLEARIAEGAPADEVVDEAAATSPAGAAWPVTDAP